MALARLLAYLVGVASMGAIAQGTVGSSLHDAVWKPPRERAAPGETRIITTTTTLGHVTVTQSGALGETPPTPAATTFITVPDRATTITLRGPAVTTTVSEGTETVSTAASTVTTTVSGPTTTTTVLGPARTTTVEGPAVTTTLPGATETVTVTQPCDPPPRPSPPPCPPHK